jgi:hypothetical protein
MFGGILDAVTNVAPKLSALSSVFTPGVGAAMGAVGSYLGSTSANKANQEMAQRQMDFQADMSGTSYQRAVKDLQAAGLSPMLAYQRGGASTPSGSTATMENVLGNATNSAINTASMMQQIRNASETEKQIIAQTEATEAGTANTRADTVNKLLTAPNITAENKRILADIALKNTTADLTSAQAYNTKRLLAPSPAIWNRGVDVSKEIFDKLKNNPQQLTPWGIGVK